MRVETLLISGLLGLLMGLPPEALSGQEGAFAFQVRGGAAVPLGAFKDEDRGWEQRAGGGTSFGMGFTVPLFRHVGGYVGFAQYRFSCDEDLCPKGKAWESTGFDVALRMVLGRQKIRPWFQGGLHTHRLETRLLDGGGIHRRTSEGGSGYELGGGILVQVGERMSLSPGVRFGEGNVPFATRPTLYLRYWVADLGLVVGF